MYCFSLNPLLTLSYRRPSIDTASGMKGSRLARSNASKYLWVSAFLLLVVHNLIFKLFLFCQNCYFTGANYDVCAWVLAGLQKELEGDNHRGVRKAVGSASDRSADGCGHCADHGKYECCEQGTRSLSCSFFSSFLFFSLLFFLGKWLCSRYDCRDVLICVAACPNNCVTICWLLMCFGLFFSCVPFDDECFE